MLQVPEQRNQLLQSYSNMNSLSDHNSPELKKLLFQIQNLTTQLSNTFQQTILKHEEQFIKAYRIKIHELTNLFSELTKVLQDKFISNALTNRLNIVLKQRDYFKYECLKLNVQYQTVVSEQNGLMSQITNSLDQVKIYKRLLEDEKIRNKQLQTSMQKVKTSFNEMAYKTLSQTVDNENALTKGPNQLKAAQKKNKKLQMTLNELQEKNQLIRNLKIKISQLEMVVNERQIRYFEKKQLYQTFKSCVNAWKRDIITKQRKGSNKSLALIGQTNGSLMSKGKNQWTPQKLSTTSKKQLLQYLFTNIQFLKFIQKLLFDENFKVQFIDATLESRKFMTENRIKLFQYMRKKKIICQNGFQLCQGYNGIENCENQQKIA